MEPYVAFCFLVKILMEIMGFKYTLILLIGVYHYMVEDGYQQKAGKIGKLYQYHNYWAQVMGTHILVLQQYKHKIFTIMKKIWNWLVSLGKDKVLHDDLVFTISLLAACLCRLLVSREWYNITACAFFAGFIAGVAKEVYDEWKYKGADERDWAADICGLVRGTLFSLILTI